MLAKLANIQPLDLMEEDVAWSTDAPDSGLSVAGNAQPSSRNAGSTLVSSLRTDHLHIDHLCMKDSRTEPSHTRTLPFSWTAVRKRFPLLLQTVKLSFLDV